MSNSIVFIIFIFLIYIIFINNLNSRFYYNKLINIASERELFNNIKINYLTEVKDIYFEKSTNKYVCVYAYYEKNKQYKDNLIFFLKNGGILDYVDYYIVLNGDCSIDFPELSNVKIIVRPNIGFDFGAWQHVIKNYIIKKYDYYIFINSSVRGPYIKNKLWLNEFINLFNTGPDVKLVGTTINIFNVDLRYFFGTDPPFTHVQSMFFILNDEGYQYLNDYGFFNDEESLNKETDILGVIFNKEIKMSQIILNHGWNINCILPKYKDLDYRTLKTNINTSGTDPCHPGAYFGGTMTPEDVIFYKLYRFQ